MKQARIIAVVDRRGRQGVNLDQPPGGTWEKLRNMTGRIEVASSDFAVIVNEEGKSRTF